MHPDKKFLILRNYVLHGGRCGGSKARVKQLTALSPQLRRPHQLIVAQLLLAIPPIGDQLSALSS